MTTLIALVESVLIVLSTVVLVLRRLFGKGRKRKKATRAVPQWHVRLQPIPSGGYHWGDGETEVQIVREHKGKRDVQGVGRVTTKVSDFDARIAELMAIAEERASSLNALDVYA